MSFSILVVNQAFPKIFFPAFFKRTNVQNKDATPESPLKAPCAPSISLSSLSLQKTSELRAISVFSP